MKLSSWAKKQGITYRTAFRWFQEGKMPCEVEQMPTGTIIVHEEINTSDKNEKVVVYCRVSTRDRKESLNGQEERCVSFANANGLSVLKTYKEIASGMNDNRSKFWEMIETNPTHIVVEHKDRLTRFGFNYIEKLLNKVGCKVIVLNKDSSDEVDLIKDLIAIITSFCCRLYGLRRGRNKVKKIKRELCDEHN